MPRRFLSRPRHIAFARRRVNDRRFTFGTGKFGDLARIIHRMSTTGYRQAPNYAEIPLG